MQQLEGFQNLNALDLNMGYCTIQLDAKSKDIITTVTEFGEIRYDVLLMIMGISGDIFQAKVNEFIDNTEGVKAYVYDILVLNKCNFADHVEQLRICFSRICKSGLNINAKKCRFLLQEIPYLWYIITREGLKHFPNKIQGIMDIQHPKTTTDRRNITGMVQLYCGMWKRIPHFLVPITRSYIGKKSKLI